jgi:putative flippase GtrA
MRSRIVELGISLYHKFRSLILYGIIGCFTASLDFCIFTLLTQFLNIHFLIANSISVLMGINASFILNRSLNFKVKDKLIRRYFIFLGVDLIGLCLSSIILWIGIEQLHINEIVAKLISIVMVVFFQFLLNKSITFRI